MMSDTSCDSDSSSGNDEPMQKNRFRFVDVLTEVPNGDAAAAKELCLIDRGITSIESLETCKNMKKLELRGNGLHKLSFLEMNHELCWLGVACNRIRHIKYLQNLACLAVLDLSDNKLARLDGLTGLPALKSLIAARNRLTRVDGILPSKNPVLEMLILPHNFIQECSLSGFKQLRKFSLSHNCLRSFPKLKALPALSEIRLNSNKIMCIPPDVKELPTLTTLDIGNNCVTELRNLVSLRGLLKIESLNLQGNQVAVDMKEEQLLALLATMPKLEIVNNRRQTGRPRKKRRIAKEQHTRRHSQSSASYWVGGERAKANKEQFSHQGLKAADSEISSNFQKVTKKMKKCFSQETGGNSRRVEGQPVPRRKRKVLKKSSKNATVRHLDAALDSSDCGVASKQNVLQGSCKRQRTAQVDSVFVGEAVPFPGSGHAPTNGSAAKECHVLSLKGHNISKKTKTSHGISRSSPLATKSGTIKAKRGLGRRKRHQHVD